MKCFGWNNYGQLGYPGQGNKGDKVGDMGDYLPFVDIGTDLNVESIHTGCKIN